MQICIRRERRSYFIYIIRVYVSAAQFSHLTFVTHNFITVFIVFVRPGLLSLSYPSFLHLVHPVPPFVPSLHLLTFSSCRPARTIAAAPQDRKRPEFLFKHLQSRAPGHLSPSKASYKFMTERQDCARATLSSKFSAGWDGVGTYACTCIRIHLV